VTIPPTLLHFHQLTLTADEIKVGNYVLDKFYTEKPEGWTLDEAIAELMQMGVPSAERAEYVLMTSLNTRYGSKHGTAHMAVLIDHYQRGEPMDEIIAEMERPGSAVNDEVWKCFTFLNRSHD
jgi:hypothetical protein